MIDVKADVGLPETIVELLARRLESGATKPALWIKRGDWHSLTWSAVGKDALRAASWLRAVGVAPGDRVIQISENRYEWLVADIAIHLSQGVHVPVHAPLTGEQIAYQIINSGARVVLVSTPEQVAKLAQVAKTLPAGLLFAAYDPGAGSIGESTITAFWEAIEGQGRVRPEDILRPALEALRSDSLATILYTSGTTGEPKGVMLTHRNLVSNTLGTVEAVGMLPDDRRLNFLPLSHIFARTCDLYTWLATGCELVLAQSRDTVLADCEAMQPTLLNAVPYFYDKVMRVLIERGQADDMNAVPELFGGRMRLLCSGGAALPDHVFDFYQQRGLPVMQGYGLSESSPVITISCRAQCRRGAVGRTIPDVEVRVTAEGEIITRGPHVMLGYYKNPAATAEVVRDGWLHTGDLGRIDEDGYLYITGRKKEILVTLGGKNIAPVYLESLLTEDPLIEQAMIIGDGRKYLSALIVPNRQALQAEMEARQLPITAPEQALRHPAVLTFYAAGIEERLRCVSSYEQVRKFTLLPRAFTIDDGELTPKLSLRRERIMANWRAAIEAMYAE